MVQDISPKVFYNQYKKMEVNDGAYVIYARGNEVFLKEENGCLTLPKAAELSSGGFHPVYLFSIDEQPFFMPDFDNGEAEEEALDSWQTDTEYGLYRLNGSGVYTPKWLYFACSVAIQLNQWYRNNRFCGRCGKKLYLKETERAFCCPCCGNTIYPKISPAVIVGVTNQDKILVTKYADRRDGTRYALIAGFCEAGETIEDTVRREVMEEVGLKVKNIRYYKSQPWSFSDTLLMGFFCELDGKREIVLDGTELSEAEWMAGQDMNMEDDGISLTYEMMDYFRKYGGYINVEQQYGGGL